MSVNKVSTGFNRLNWLPNNVTAVRGTVNASGATSSTTGSYTVQTWTGNGSLSFSSTVTAQIRSRVIKSELGNLACDYFLVGGGGGGGGRHGGGGGGGGVIHVTGATLSASTYSVTVGAGGPVLNGETQGHQGENTTAFGETALGGGGSGGYQGSVDANKLNGGCGCGAADRGQNTGKGWDNKGAGNTTQGNPVLAYGGSGNKYGHRGGSTDHYHAGGGGGGANSDGQSGRDGSPDGGGDGGAGIQINFDGNNHYWAGGGGGNHYGDNSGYPGGDGGIGGGGGGGICSAKRVGHGGGSCRNDNAGNGGQHSCSNSGGNGGTNTGGGGGGGAGNSCMHGGGGGSGIVMVRYLT